jgi:hypothetical protein
MIFGFLPQIPEAKAEAVAFSMAGQVAQVESGPPGGAAGRLSGFRRELYGCFTARADALFELTDAVLCADGPVRSLAELSLCPVFRRGHGALYDALACGGVDEDRLRDALIGALPEGLPLLFAVDVTAFPRPDAACSPGRVHCYACCRCDGRRKTIPGWNYSRITGVDWGTSSWVCPVDAVRLRVEDDQAEVTAAQVRDLVARLEAAGRCGGPGQPVPVAILDSGYSPPALTYALAGTAVQVLVRLRDEGRRAFYGPPPPGRVPGQPGRPRRHGKRFKLSEAAGWPPADQVLIVEDSGRYGRVEVRAWHGLHQKLQGRGHFAGRPQPAAVPGTVIQVKAERLPDGRTPAGAMWLWWAAPPGTACDLDMIWRAYLRRFDAEHGFRFDKGTLGWTCARLRTPEQADLWTWLVIAAYTQLHLARHLTTDLRRPWERPPRPGRELSPARVRRGFRHIRSTIGTPASGPKPSRPGPGRPKGSTRGPAQRHAVAKKNQARPSG